MAEEREREKDQVSRGIHTRLRREPRRVTRVILLGSFCPGILLLRHSSHLRVACTRREGRRMRKYGRRYGLAGDGGGRQAARCTAEKKEHRNIHLC